MSATVAPDPTFVHRKIDVSIRLGTGAFGATGSDTVNVSGLRVSAMVTKQTGDFRGMLDLHVFGLTESIMRQVCKGSTGRIGSVIRNDTVTLTAGDDTNGMTQAYVGTILTASMDYAGSPDISLHILSNGAQVAALAPVSPSSFEGGADVATIMSGFANLAGLNFENHGLVGVVLHDPYFPGSAYDQIRECAQAARIGWTIEDGTLAIWPRGGARTGNLAISPATGMVGYPSTFKGGIGLTMLYSSAVRVGSTITVMSSNTQACGSWHVNEVSHALESETPDGAWFTSLTCSQFGTDTQ